MNKESELEEKPDFDLTEPHEQPMGYAEGGDVKPPFEAPEAYQAGSNASMKSVLYDNEPVGPVESIGKQALAGLAGIARGATLGLSDVAMTHADKLPQLAGYSLLSKALGGPDHVDPKSLTNLEESYPVTSAASNMAGTAAMLIGTGGLGGLAEGAGLAAKAGVGALEGAGIGGLSKATDDWSQNKALDAQKIVGSAGLGALLGTAGATIGSGLKSIFGRSALTKVAPTVEKDASAASEAVNSGAQPPVDPPASNMLMGKVTFKGVQPTTYEDLVSKVKNAKADGTAIPLPAQGELDNALARIEMENPVNPLQRDSLGSQHARDLYQTFKVTPGEIGQSLTNYEAIQKAELVGKAAQAVKDISPGIEPIADAYQGGKHAIDAFTEQYQAEKKALSPIFEAIKKQPLEGDILPDSVQKMAEAVPGIADMFDTTGADLAIHPYRSAWGIDKSTYNAVKEAVQSLSESENNMGTLWNIRKGLDQHIDVMTQGQAPSEIRALKAALMEQMQEASRNPEIREAFKRYAINEQQRQVIEKAFGASVGSPEFGQISKVKPELIGDKIFGNTATVEAAKNILPKEKFQSILANWVLEAKTAATDKGAFSSNKFGSFLRRNQDVLNIAFQDNPQTLQRLKDLTTLMRILPDSVSVNPSGTAKTLMNMIMNTKMHDLTWEGALASVPQTVVQKLNSFLKMKELNKALSGQASKNAQIGTLKGHSLDYSRQLEKGVNAIFGTTSVHMGGEK